MFILLCLASFSFFDFFHLGPILCIIFILGAITVGLRWKGVARLVKTSYKLSLTASVLCGLISILSGLGFTGSQNGPIIISAGPPRTLLVDSPGPAGNKTLLVNSVSFGLLSLGLAIVAWYRRKINRLSGNAAEELALEDRIRP
jgi:hypothetical protein